MQKAGVREWSGVGRQKGIYENPGKRDPAAGELNVIQSG